MVHDVEDAVGVFLTSDIDLLVLNDLAFRKPAGEPVDRSENHFAQAQHKPARNGD
jgi:hypothetical protein